MSQARGDKEVQGSFELLHPILCQPIPPLATRRAKPPSGSRLSCGPLHPFPVPGDRVLCDSGGGSLQLGALISVNRLWGSPPAGVGVVAEEEGVNVLGASQLTVHSTCGQATEHQWPHFLFHVGVPHVPNHIWSKIMEMEVKGGRST